MKTFQWIAAMATALAALTAASGAYAQEYALHARVSYDTGSAMIKGNDDADWSQAPTNTLVLPGDMLWVDRSGNMELELSGGTFLRLADGSKAELVSLPPSGRVKGWVGSFYVHRIERSADQMTIETPACQVSVAKDSVVRVDVLEQGATTVSVRFGQAIVLGGDGSQTVANAGERCWADPGMLPSEVAPFDRKAEDDFDSWNRQRIDVLLSGMRTLPKTVAVSSSTLGYADLGGCGEWVEVDAHTYWRPTVSVDFVPYRHGHWSFVMGVGHTWVEDYPFGYITSHYGRWGYFPSHGWMWSYDPVWSPAWVATVRCGDYYVWTPVDYDCRPVAVTQSAFFSIGGVSFGLSASSYVPVTHLYDGWHYVDYCTPTVVSYVEHHHTEINIWNINTGPRNHVRVPYDAGLTERVRNYNPSRSIRGPASLERSLPVASARVAKLESGMGRATFTKEGAAQTRPSARTRLTDSDRASRVRTVSLSDRAPSRSTEVSRAESRPRRGDVSPAPSSGRATRTEPEAARTPVATVDMDQTPGRPAGRAPSVRQDASPDRQSVRTPARTQSPKSSSSLAPSSPGGSTASPAPARRAEDRPSVRAPQATGPSPARERSPQRDVAPSIRPAQPAEPKTSTRSNRSDVPSVRPSQSVEPRPSGAAPERSRSPMIERPSTPAPQMQERARQEAPRPSVQPMAQPQVRETPRPSPRANDEDASRRSSRSSSERSNSSRR